MQVQQMIPEDFMMREEQMKKMVLKSANLQCASRNLSMNMCSAPGHKIKKSSAGLFGNVISSISNGVTSFFSKNLSS